MSLIRRILRNHTAHKKLGEDTSLAISEADVSLCGDTTERRFDLKLVGTAPAERAASAPATANAVAKAVALAKASRKKLRKVTLTVSPKGIVITDAANAENIMELSIFRISYCSADAAHGGIFAVVVGGVEEGLACHAFLADKRKTARAVALAAAQAFNAAYQAWQSNQDKQMYHRPTRSQPWAEEPKTTQETEATNPLIDFRNSSNMDSSNMSPWVSFDDEEDEMNEAAWDVPPNSMPLVTLALS